MWMGLAIWVGRICLKLPLLGLKPDHLMAMGICMAGAFYVSAFGLYGHLSPDDFSNDHHSLEALAHQNVITAKQVQAQYKYPTVGPVRTGPGIKNHGRNFSIDHQCAVRSFPGSTSQDTSENSACQTPGPIQLACGFISFPTVKN